MIPCGMNSDIPTKVFGHERGSACAWLRPNGDARDWKLIADIGCPVPLVIGVDDLPDCSFSAGANVQSNCGFLESAWLHLAMAEFGLDFLILGYSSEEVLDSARTDHPDIGGLVGLPFLRLLEYGGNANEFWIRPSERPA
jgi:hypothetical protein